MRELSNLFKPITNHTLNKSDTYLEIEPCDDLKSYIRCFWGSPVPYINKESIVVNDRDNIVIPDCCMDIIFDIDYSNNKVNNLFCNINDAPFYTEEITTRALVSTFGIRFNFWTTYLFADDKLPKRCNEFANVDQHFVSLRKDIEDIIINHPKIEERIYYVEKLLIKKLLNKRLNDNLLNGVYHILKSKGVTTISEVSNYTSISSRQLERVFKEYIGISPKKCCSLVRYQNVWKDLAFSREFNPSNIAYNYGYSDQAHMINDFKKYHGSTPMKAIQDLNK